jgi:hypothetical protein
MKKLLLIASLVMLGIFTISCGGKNGETKSEVNTEEVADCACNTLIDTTGYLKDKNYTGTCADKDQNDTIILKKEYKNGYLISKMTKEKVKGKYYTTQEMTFDDEKEFNGYNIEISEIYKSNGQKYSGHYKRYKDGQLIDDYGVICDKMLLDQSKFSIRVCWYTKNGKLIEYNEDNLNEESRPKCMPDSEPHGSYGNGVNSLWWELENLDITTFDNVVEGLQKELPHFFFAK